MIHLGGSGAILAVLMPRFKTMWSLWVALIWGEWVKVKVKVKDGGEGMNLTIFQKKKLLGDFLVQKKTDWKPVDFHHWSLSWCPKGTNKKWTNTSPPLGFQRFDMMNLEWEVLPLGHMEIEGSEDGATKRRCRADFNWKHIHGKVGDFRWRNPDFDLKISQTQRLYSYIQSKCLETRNSKCIQDAVDFCRQSLFFPIECFHYCLLTEDWVAEVFRDCVLFRLHSVRAVGSLPWEPELSICEDSLDSWCFWKFGGFETFFLSFWYVFYWLRYMGY